MRIVAVRTLQQAVRGFGERMLQHHGGAIIERMGEWCIGLDPAQAEALQRQRFQKWRGNAQGVGRGAQVVAEPRQRDLGRGAGATDSLVALPYRNGHALPRQRDGGGETVDPGTHDIGGTKRHRR